MHRTLTAGTLVVVCSVLFGWVLAQEPERQQATIKEDPLDKLLVDFAAAAAKFDIEKGEQLFLAPDDTPAGKNRQEHLAEMRRDWKRAKERGEEAGPTLHFKNTKKMIQTQMTIRDGAKQQTSEFEFTVVFTDQGWKIVSMGKIRRK